MYDDLSKSVFDAEGASQAPCPPVLLFHKPKGVVVTRRDERGRRTVYDCLPPWVAEKGFVPVGRLDRDSRGLLLFTMDRFLMDRLTRPRQCSKTYEVWVRGRPTEKQIQSMLTGVETRGEMLHAREIVLTGNAGPKTRLSVVLDEGRNRHIRRMFGALHDEKTGLPIKVTDLKRIRFGPISLDIPSGSFRALSISEIQELYRIGSTSIS